ncbi:hypothetical protein [Actinomadura citrea]|uniref:Uncharacterized protein n=1 Tax=Actinomadura citrea TaxID=46158 RepID=A0A7Y9GJ22_9ACTN|nr:hypothetical protein [Actinomadura citrea]NYE17373.1 hypothetical protein [Actinomadura citrea]GGU00599.1 hypothetical protein GCM10010177_69610 [Actinomadura citrea]
MRAALTCVRTAMISARTGLEASPVGARPTIAKGRRSWTVLTAAQCREISDKQEEEGVKQR